MKFADENASVEKRERLTEVWKILEVLTVSLDRIGTYEALHGTERGQAAFAKFMLNPAMFQRITTARTYVQQLLLAQDPALEEQLEAWSDDEVMLGYWQAPPSATSE
jgi:hypothetical protein